MRRTGAVQKTSPSYERAPALSFRLGASPEVLSSLLGPGTEYVPETHVNRHALDRSFRDFATANRAIVRDERFVFRGCPGDVLLMKGLGASRGGGAVHRSPPIEETRETRIVLVLSTVERQLPPFERPGAVPPAHANHM